VLAWLRLSLTWKRIRGLESRVQRAEEGVTAIVSTVLETRDGVKWLKVAVQALLGHNGINIDRPADDDI
jgi:hypothetical protein